MTMEQGAQAPETLSGIKQFLWPHTRLGVDATREEKTSYYTALTDKAEQGGTVWIADLEVDDGFVLDLYKNGVPTAVASLRMKGFDSDTAELWLINPKTGELTAWPEPVPMTMDMIRQAEQWHPA